MPGALSPRHRLTKVSVAVTPGRIPGKDAVLPISTSVGCLGCEGTAPATPQHQHDRTGPPREDDLGLLRAGCRHRGDWRLWATIEAWWPAVEVLIATRVTNARTQAANTGVKHIKRTGRGYRNPAHYEARILLTSAARRAA
jgi:Transposase